MIFFAVCSSKPVVANDNLLDIMKNQELTKIANVHIVK
ncbi:MAG: hypothetical protein ACJA1A_001382 [Saprospiraceae bacterium]|jgi:hypothetical protein